MSSLDELFGEALDNAAAPTTQERRAAVAQVTVEGARRRRRKRAAGEAAGILSTVALAAAVFAMVITSHGVPPANTTPTPPDPTPSATSSAPPDAATALDPRLAPAPAMTRDDWRTVTFTWDAELASFIGGGKDGYGSVLAIYLTPPGGSRRLAYANATSFIEAPSLLGFDPQTQSVMLSSGSASGGVQNLNLRTGAITDVPLNLPDPIVFIAPMGKISNGDDLFVVTTTDSHANRAAHVFRTFNNTAIPVIGGKLDASPVFEDRFVVIENGEFRFIDGDAEPPAPIPGAADCGFAVWNTDGTFVANCGATQARTGTYVQVDPDAGTVTQVWADAPWKGTDGPPASLTLFHALSPTRTWTAGTTTEVVPMRPPAIYENGEQVADLADGFAETPKTYGVIFGYRP